ncbi:unnamed protein product [Bursaphelenchus okinawaensis]|uniref:Uncharacterized protein n=1 Tax=Bursaphelenchus okinawaensis TaxID=465554 RepID=A0A811K9Y5_9BILA|nr:unnamed protein product [Bursaphelenchus okinawaensis]CAG9098618.1 unnamed protein product [Bursaphelenchus okinawaensis]
MGGGAGGTAMALLVFALLTPYWYNLEGVNVSIRKGFVCLEEDSVICKTAQKRLAKKFDNAEQKGDGSFSTSGIKTSFYIFCAGAGMAVLSVVVALIGLFVQSGLLLIVGAFLNFLAAGGVGTSFGWFLNTFIDPQKLTDKLITNASHVKEQMDSGNFFGTSFFATAGAAGLLIVAAIFNIIANLATPSAEPRRR